MRNWSSRFNAEIPPNQTVKENQTAVRPNFPRNLSPDFVQYISEGPEMTSSQWEATEGQNKKRKSKL